MEDQNKPLNFERLWNFVKGMYPFRRERESTLYPYEVKEILAIKGSQTTTSIEFNSSQTIKF